MREELQGEERVAQGVLLRPRPAQQHHEIGKRGDGRDHPPRHLPALADGVTKAFRLDAHQQDRAEHDSQVDEGDNAADAHAKREAQSDSQLDEQRRLRPRQGVAEPGHVVERPDHSRGERDVLGVIEHVPVPGRGHQLQDGGEKGGAGAGEGVGELPAADHAYQPDQGVQQVAGFVLAERRDQVGEGHHAVEHAAVQIEVVIGENRPVLEQRRVVGEHMHAVRHMVVRIPRDSVVAERRQDDREHCDQARAGQSVPGRQGLEGVHCARQRVRDGHYAGFSASLCSAA